MSRKFEELELVIATHNRGKLEEFRALFAGVPLPPIRRGGGVGAATQTAQMHLRPAGAVPARNTDHLTRPRNWAERLKLLSSADFKLPAPDETGTTFLENAKIKALYTAQATERPSLADDSGMCVTALDGAPGVYSADWAELEKGGPRDFNVAMQKVQDGIGSDPDRSAAFVACLVLAWPDGHIEYVEGRLPGTIVWPPRGKGGHGYDPIFMPQGYDITYAEMDSGKKNAISHRGLAFRKLMDKCFS